MVRFLLSGVLSGCLAAMLLGCQVMRTGKDGFVISQSGKARAVICIGTNAAPVVQFAGQELKTYLEKITGASFEIIPGETAPAGMNRIMLGNCSAARAAGLDAKALGPDEFYVKVSEGTLFLCGHDDLQASKKHFLNHLGYRPRGTLVGVYKFLETYGGVRWLFPGPDGEYVPQKKDLSMPAISIKNTPGMKMRYKYSVGGDDLKAINGKKADEAFKLFAVRMGHSSWKMAQSHYFAYEYSASRWVTNHPEYFGMDLAGQRNTNYPLHQGWRMCFSNPELAHEVALDAIAYFKGEPASSRNLPKSQFNHFGFNRESFAINPADWCIGECHCKECQKYRDKDGGYSELAWLYYMRVANEVVKECPGKIISVWSYADYSTVPRSIAKAPENTRVFIVTGGGAFEWALKGRRRKLLQKIESWHKFSGHKMYMWVNMCLRYYRPQILDGVPSPCAGIFGKWMKESARYFNGGFFDNSSKTYMFEALNSYLFYHLAWDPNQDYEALVRDYYSAAYGPAAENIRAIEDSFEKMWFKHIYRERFELGYLAFGKVDTLPTRAEVWENIYTEEYLAGLKRKMDEAVERVKGTPFEKRVEIFNQYYLGEVFAQHNHYFELLGLADDIRLAAIKKMAPITIDGQLDEPDWTNAPAGKMVSIRGNKTPFVETEVRVLYDNENLYVAWKCHEPEISRLKTIIKKHDNFEIWKDDDVELFLDPTGKRQDYFQILVNAAGVYADTAIRDRVERKDWESNARIGVHKDKDFWSVEMAIPYSVLNTKPPAVGETWVANFCRSRALADGKKGESQFLSWSKMVKDGFRQPQSFGRIVFTEKGVIPEDADNLIKNGSFEKGRENWGGINCVFEAGNAVHGGHYAKIEGRGSVMQGISGSLKPNTKYVFSYYVRCRDIVPNEGQKENQFAGVGFELHLNERGWSACPDRFIRGTADWHKYVISVKTGAKLSVAPAVRLQVREATGTAWVDAVKLKEVRKKSE